MTRTAEEYQDEDWVTLYKAAVTELETAKMTGRIHATRIAIVARLEKLATLPGLHPHEGQAIDDATRTLKFLEREHARLDEETGRRAVEESLQKLCSAQRLSKRVLREINSTSCRRLCVDGDLIRDFSVPTDAHLVIYRLTRMDSLDILRYSKEGALGAAGS